MSDMDLLLAFLDDRPVEDPARLRGVLKDLGIDALDPDGISTLRSLLTDMVDKSGLGVSALFKLDYLEKPVSPEQFLDDPYYFGHVGSWDEIAQSGLWPAWREHLIEVMDPGNGITELILTGAIGIGKTSVSLIIIAYRIYLLSLMIDPYRFFKQLKINRFHYGLYNVYKYKADEMYLKLKEAINASPYFQERFPTNPRKKDSLEFPRHVVVVWGASEMEALGENLIACHLSEVNFMRAGKTEELGQAWRIFKNVSKRIRSRFLFQGFSPGIVILDSSRRSQTDMLEERLVAVEDDPHTKVVAGALWEFKPKEEFTGQRFRLALGTALTTSRILEDDEVVPADVEVIDVPEEFRKDFVDDPDGATRDIAGRATHAVRPFFTDREALARCSRPELVHPFSREVVCLSTGSPDELVEYLVRDRLVTIKGGRYTPRFGQGRQRFMHVDLSRNTDSTGIAMGHVHSMKWTEPYAQDIDAPVLTLEIEIDFMLRIVPPPPPFEIDYVKIRRFIAALTEMGFDIGRVTFDGYQAVDMIQTMRRAGYQAEELSMDRTEKPYFMLKSVVTEGRLRCYHYAPFIGEVTRLERNVRKKKIDHPHKGSKDLSDAVCGVVWNCTMHAHEDVAVDPAPKYVDTGVDMRSASGRLVLGERMAGEQLIGRDYKG